MADWCIAALAKKNVIPPQVRDVLHETAHRVQAVERAYVRGLGHAVVFIRRSLAVA